MLPRLSILQLYGAGNKIAVGAQARKWEHNNMVKKQKNNSRGARLYVCEFGTDSDNRVCDAKYHLPKVVNDQHCLRPG